VDSVSRDASAVPELSLKALFLGFLEIALSSFGGALAWSRRIIVERRQWLTDRQFAELLAICQVLPGGNIINMSIWMGAESRGYVGAFVTLLGFLGIPFLTTLALGALYDLGTQFQVVQSGLRGASSVIAGMSIATGLKLVWPYRREPWALALAVVTMVAIGVLRLPLVPVILCVGPIGMAAVKWVKR